MDGFWRKRGKMKFPTPHPISNKILPDSEETRSGNSRHVQCRSLKKFVEFLSTWVRFEEGQATKKKHSGCERGDETKYLL
jgi:hypothetical protein